MRKDRWLALALLATVTAVASCAPVASPGGQVRGDPQPRASTPKRLIAAISSNPTTLRSNFPGGASGGAAAGVDVLEDLVHAGATRRDDRDVLRPVLAEALPSIENGLWKQFPDGRMETTWTLKNAARWQDGAPVTSQDLLFSLRACRDDEVARFCMHVGFDYIDTAAAPDDHTVTVTWTQPFIDADALFTTEFAMPIPRHLVERPYLENKRGLIDLPYWNREFVGAGPFRVREWVEGSHIILSAFEGYVLGRPRLDEILVKFIPDANTLVANMLAGEVDVNLGRGMALDQAIEIREQWREGRIEVGLINLVMAYPQFIDPRPAALLDVRFRKGLVHALNRQEMVETLQAGLVPVAHSFFDTAKPQYRELDPFVVKYDFDPRRAVQLIESSGYTRGSDGHLRDGAGQRLVLETRTSGGQEIQNKAQSAVAYYWRAVGSEVEEVIMTPQRMSDREYLATRPAFQVGQNTDEKKGLRRAHSSQTPLPENNYTRTGNNSRYINSEFDALLDRFFSTIPLPERTQVLGQVLHHASDQLVVIPLFFGTHPKLVSKRLLNFGPRKTSEGTEGWNAHEWDIR